MLNAKRHGDILRIVGETGTISVTDLAHRLGVSLETVRRDVRPLADAGTLLKLHGAVSLPGPLAEAPFERRMRDNADAKRAVAARIAAMIDDGDAVMLDTGTTTSFLARALMSKRRLTVVTNSSDIARTLATVNDNTVYMAGGQLRGDSGAAFGAAAIAFVKSFRVRFAIITTAGIDAGCGLMDFDLAEAEFARAVLECGETRLVATDSSKFGRRALVRICGFGDVDRIVTDAAPPADIAEQFAANGVAVDLA
ncbi:DeoR/GlpR family DNA-binding transcription regulator [Methylobrevis albus]|uniref:DeoR/GlpR transcriptional regulator n=1 Tax=Methylobrevis albus TaxID=2793297 RepID=A0A931HZL7_9HYPH|nr:DeoR/GlpR family DNA-binding transcription regulator [Methylobrevis albus]MBH0237662.1 DeoR/GlpR transcriptional regulator [Methylobrevis albus]